MSVDQAPIGAIMAFGGLAATNLAQLHAAGWLPCDGGSYAYGGGGTYDPLQSVIGLAFGGGNATFNVPDFRGRFLRGVNKDRTPAMDPEAAARYADKPGGNKGNLVGSVQAWGTGLPAAPFTSAVSTGHTHSVPNLPQSGNANAVAGSTGHDTCEWNSDAVTTDSQGAHTHTLSTGGDAETRPPNLYLYWFIKYANTP